MTLQPERKWTPGSNKLLREWEAQVAERERGHDDVSQQLSKKHFFYGSIATVIAAFVTSGGFATFQNCNEDLWICDAMPWIRLIFAVVSAIGVAIIAYQTFNNFQDKAEKHSTASKSYECLQRDISSLLSTPLSLRSDPIETLINYREKFNTIARDAPSLPKKYRTELNSTPTETKNTKKTVKVPLPPPPPMQTEDKQRDDEILEKMLQTTNSERSEFVPLRRTSGKVNLDTSVQTNESSSEEDFDLDSFHPPEVKIQDEELRSISEALRLELNRMGNSSNIPIEPTKIETKKKKTKSNIKDGTETFSRNPLKGKEIFINTENETNDTEQASGSNSNT